MVAKKENKSKCSKAIKRSTPSVKPKEFLVLCVNHIARKIVVSKTVCGRTPHGVAKTLLQEGQTVFPNMTMNMINYAVKKLMDAEMKPKLKKSAVIFGEQNCVCSLTGDSTTSGINMNNTEHAAGALLALSSSHSRESNDLSSECDSSVNKNGESTESNFLDELLAPSEAKSTGRPKGSTASEAKCLQSKVEAATKEAVENFQNLCRQSSAKKQSGKGLLDEIIKKSMLKHGVEEGVIIDKNTVRQWLKRGSKHGHVGQTTPMLAVEPYLVELFIQLANMRTPITSTQGLQLANSLISGTKIEEESVEWMSHNCHAYKMTASGSEKGKQLGLGYWKSFLKRKKAVKFDNKCADWCTYQNM